MQGFSQVELANSLFAEMQVKVTLLTCASSDF
jgi:hypothetical protein